MIDTHCHLNFPALGGELDAVLGRARAAGVTRIIVPGVDAQSSAEAVALAKRYRGEIFAAVGIHPSDASAYDAASFSVDGAIAIGEVGLDFYHAEENPPAEVQETVFREMIALAETHDLPLIIHSREAFDATYAILKDVHRPTVLHCFTGTAEEARAWLDLGFHLSLTGIITYKKNAALREMVATLPLDRIMTETDAPYLAPEGYRGQTCEPWHVSKVVECLAEIHGKTAQEIADTTEATARAFFRI